MLVVAHNLEAQNTNRQLNISQDSKSKAMEKLSSGYRINRSADDAAGLAISEKMRWQVRGLNQDVRNAKDGYSMIQVAEGAMNEMHGILQRMNELAVQAANDTNTSLDRAAISNEIDELKGEINRISKTTTFNTIKVLEVPQLVEIDASNDSNKMDVLTNVPGIGNRYARNLDFSKVTESNKSELIGKSFTVTCSANCQQVFTFRFSDETSTTAEVVDTGFFMKDLVVDVGINDPSLTSGEDIVNAIYSAVSGIQSELGTSSGDSDIFIGHANGLGKNNSTLILYAVYDGPPYEPGMGEVRMDNMRTDTVNFHLQVGALGGQSIDLELKTINCLTLGIGDLPVDSYAHAGNTMTTVQNAIDAVSRHRSYLGAISNRLEHTIDNLNNTSENTQAAESAIRDADMAKEMIEYSTRSILEQAGESILAQANQSKQGIINLLT